jgi:hypothetical protein
VHAANPSQHETFRLDFLEFQYSEKFQVHVLEFMVLDLNDTLDDASVIFRVWVEIGLQSEVRFSIVHVALYVDDFFKHTKDVAFSMFDRVEKEMIFPESGG